MENNNLLSLNLLKEYKIFLESFSEEEFVLTPPSKGWSYSEVFTHIIAANELAILSIYKCARPNSEPIKKTDWRVKLILFIGSLPPGKYKVPSILADKAIKSPKEVVLKNLDLMMERINGLSDKMKNANKDSKAKHPRLGYLNAFHWSRFIFIHTKHHLKQLKRIQMELKFNS